MNRKKTIQYLVYPLLFVLALTFTFCRKQPQLNDQTVAIVGEYAIPFKEYKKRYADYLDATYQKDNLYLRLGVLRNMINEILLRHYDNNQTIYNNPEYKKELAWADREMPLGYLKGVEVFDKIKVSDAEARQAFLRVNEKIAARHLYAKTKEEADHLYDELKHGASFDSLARVVFTDSTLRNNGGYLGYFTWGDMDPAFEDTAYSLKVGQISKPVKTAHGYSIIKVEDRKRVPILTENEYLNKKEKIIRLVRTMRKKKAVARYLHSIFDDKELVFETDGLDRLWSLLKEKKDEKELSPRAIKQTAAYYRGKPLSVGYLYRELTRVPDFHLQKIQSIKDLKIAVKGILINETLWRIAQQKHYDQVPEVREAIRNAHNNIYLKFKRAEILARAQVPDSALRHYYRKEIFKFNKPRMMNVRELLVKDFQLALRLKKKLMDGADFARLAERYSLRKWSAQNGGLLGYSDWNRFGNIKKKLWNAPIGKLIGPIKVGAYYGIFRVEGKRDAQPMPFEQARAAVLKEYKGENQTELIRAYLLKLRKKVKIKRNLKLVKSFDLQENPN